MSKSDTALLEVARLESELKAARANLERAKTKVATPQHIGEGEIRIGNAVLVPHENGGWALPGGGATDDRDIAVAIATRIHQHVEGGVQEKGL